MELLHRFPGDVKVEELPRQFNNPFYYSPHALCVVASNEVRGILSRDTVVAEEVARGKMFGVLVVEDAHGGVGYLAAFSGLLNGGNRYKGFVPPVYDMLSPDGYFKREEAAITSLNGKIRAAECDSGFVASRTACTTLEAAMEKEVSAMREEMRRSKEKRDVSRASGLLSPSDEAALVRESQFQKAELKRLVAGWKRRITDATEKYGQLNAELAVMKNERKRRSAALQEWLFTQFKVLNAHGEEKSLLKIFDEKRGTLPPAGAGECAAPKLLQYAYRKGFRPLAMAEFWLGDSPAGEVRRDGCFYVSCKSKCEPILSFMLQGIDMEENALENGTAVGSVEVVYEDESILVVNKPAGVLSVPGIVGGMSVQQWLREEYLHSNELFVVHRLDMATSGLLLAAKSIEVDKAMQSQFAARGVVKHYMALLQGVPRSAAGVVELPLASDYDNRPCQKVDYDNGKYALTRYRVADKVLCGGKECALVDFEPVTGRTHQLRVHAAHKEGLDCPIMGDALYGTASGRLKLHASSISFVHPVSGKEMTIEKQPASDFYL